MSFKLFCLTFRRFKMVEKKIFRFGFIWPLSKGRSSEMVEYCNVFYQVFLSFLWANGCAAHFWFAIKLLYTILEISAKQYDKKRAWFFPKLPSRNTAFRGSRRLANSLDEHNTFAFLDPVFEGWARNAWDYDPILATKKKRKKTEGILRLGLNN